MTAQVTLIVLMEQKLLGTIAPRERYLTGISGYVTGKRRCFVNPRLPQSNQHLHHPQPRRLHGTQTTFIIPSGLRGYALMMGSNQKMLMSSIYFQTLKYVVKRTSRPIKSV